MHLPYIARRPCGGVPEVPRRMLPFWRGIQGCLHKPFSFIKDFIYRIIIVNHKVKMQSIYLYVHGLRRRRTAAWRDAGPGLVLPRHRRHPLEATSLPKVLNNDWKPYFITLLMNPYSLISSLFHFNLVKLLVMFLSHSPWGRPSRSRACRSCRSQSCRACTDASRGPSATRSPCLKTRNEKNVYYIFGGVILS